MAELPFDRGGITATPQVQVRDTAERVLSPREVKAFARFVRG